MLAYVIRIIHYLLLIFAIFTPMLDPSTSLLNELLLVMHTILMPGIMIHWLVNNNTCSLTLLEAQLTNTPMDKTFIASILHPFFEINDYFIYGLAILLWSISFYKLYNSPHGFRLIKQSFNIIFNRSYE